MHILPKYCVWFSDLLTYFPSKPLISSLMIFLCSWSDSWTHRARLQGCHCGFLVCSLATILFTKTGVTVLHVQFNYKRGRLFQAWHFKSGACHHSWSSCLWDRVHGLILDSVYNREGTWHRDPVHLEIESASFFFFYIATKSAEVLFSQVKYFMSVSGGNYNLSLNRYRSCCCATFAQEVWVFLCHYSCITLTGAICLWLAFWLETRDGTHRKKNISSRSRTRLETHLVFEDTFGLGVRSNLVLFLGKPPPLTSGISTTCQCLLRMSDLCFRHLLPPQSLSALSSFCAPCYHVPKTSV